MLVLVGASGTGRTTFVNTLCESEVLSHKTSDVPESAHIEEGIKIKPVNVELEEDGVRISLTIVDTPGFGDNSGSLCDPGSAAALGLGSSCFPWLVDNEYT
jgi:cell division control protein 11